MPEGPEVRVIADVIATCINHEFINAEICKHPGKSYRFNKTGIVNLDFLNLAAWKIQAVETYGKLIRIDIQSEVYGAFSVLNTLGMTGSWSKNVTHHKHERVKFLKEDGNLTFLDIRNFGTIRIVRPPDANKLVKKIGWDLLKAPCNDELWESFQNHRYITDLPVASALMSQKLFAGIGSIYRSELLYALKIHPLTTVRVMYKGTWNKINKAAHSLLVTSYQAGGTTVETYAADGRAGRMQDLLKIYGKSVCPEKHITSYIQVDGRPVWYCERCLDA